MITGIANSATVFTIQNTLANTFGNFATIVNPEAAREVDALLIRLSNPACAPHVRIRTAREPRKRKGDRERDLRSLQTRFGQGVQGLDTSAIAGLWLTA